MDPTIQKLLEHTAAQAFNRQQVWAGELEKAQRAAGNAHDVCMQAISYGGFRSIVQGDDPEAGMAYNFAKEIPGSNLGPLPAGKTV